MLRELATKARLGPAFAAWGLRGDRRGITAVEYAIIAGIMVIAIVLSVPLIGKDIAPIFNNVSSSL